jgi:hypothetical protein
MTDRSKESDAPNFGYDGFVYYSNSTGRPHPYRFGLYVLASTLGITYNDTYDSVIEALESATVLNKAFAGGYYLNRLP